MKQTIIHVTCHRCAHIHSDSLPFVEYELHQQLMNKLRVYSLNALFGVRITVSVGEKLITAVASATGVHLPALPQPPMIQINRSLEVEDAEDAAIVDIQDRIMQISKDTRTQYMALKDSMVSATTTYDPLSPNPRGPWAPNLVTFTLPLAPHCR